MLKKAFAPEFWNLVKQTGSTGIDNIEKDFHELTAAGIFRVESKHILWLVGENENLKEKQEKLDLWFRFLGVGDFDIHCYKRPFEDPYINNHIDYQAIGYKAKFVSSLLENRRLILMTTCSALSVKIETPGQLQGYFLRLSPGLDINRGELTEKLLEMGYRSRDLVEERGDIALRGSIVDIFPIDNSRPVRIEIEADQVISIRLFNPDTQKSIGKIKHILVPVARFFINYGNNNDYFCRGRDDDNMTYITSLLDKPGYRVIASDIRGLKDEFQKLTANFDRIYEMASEKEKDITTILPSAKTAELFDFPLHKEKILSFNDTHDSISSDSHRWLRFNQGIKELKQADIGAIKDKIDNNNLELFISIEDDKIAENLREFFGDFHRVPVNFPYSFENPSTSCLFLNSRGYRFREKNEYLRESSELKSERLINEIVMGDLVVHKTHGIGKFIGFTKLGFEDNISEFLKLEYINKEYLYVPVYELDVLSKYVAFEGYSPRMDKMGGSTWRSKQTRAQKSIITFARELLQLYAMRKAIDGTSFVKDYELEDRLVQEFRYVETGDQKRAIRDVFKDLEARFPMDRLICGDVSFGKTEVAIRAAFRVVANGRQVAVLCPTTILAYQHFSTFKKRFENFPLNVVMLSRMVTGNKKKVNLEGLASGKVDVVVGTHSLLSKNVVFKRLGLYIIDEEQRFGVFQKEKLKKNREDIDALSLSATPIPRTLSLSLAGLQDISNIQTPPIGRIAIKNYVGWFSREILVSAILNELERDGLVFIIYNNVEKIYTFQEQLQQWMPETPSVVIHAQMKSEAIEKNLMDFIHKKYRVLISTTIIENGIDIPDVNTLIVLGADRFGLTQLYQLRGRIGRGSRQAFAYFLIKGRISDKARVRLDAIREFAELGSGYKLAELDLELRGAGSLLGNRQHGHIEALGFDYYHRLLNQTVKELKGDLEKKKEPRVKIHFSYSIDPSYIPNSSERIAVYRSILEASEYEELDEIKFDLNDRYGRLPKEVEKIFYAGSMRVLAKKCSFDEVELYPDRAVICFPLTEKGEPPVNRYFLNKFKAFEMLIQDERTCEFHFEDYEEFIFHFKSMF